MVFPPTCSINLFATSSTISSNPNHFSSQFQRKSSIFAFLSLVHTPFRFALKSHVFAMQLTLTLTFAFSFTLLHASPLSFPFRIKFLRSGVVYVFKCRCCSASYVGQTTRHLHTRASEHLGISPIMGKPSSNPPMSSIFSHLKTTGHTANFDDFQILSSCLDNCEIMIHESLLISNLKPTLNFQGNSIPLNLLQLVFLFLSSLFRPILNLFVLSCAFLYLSILYMHSFLVT